jgi:thioredoxin reductase
LLDVIVVGAGPAGLSGALILGRCRRRVLVLDDGHPRNAAACALHGFLSRDGIAPGELLHIGREQLRPYTTVELRHAEVTAAERGDHRFTVTLRGGERCDSRFLLLATGVVDDIPDVPGIERFYGASVHHCPYCDGWEHRDEPLAIYGRVDDGAGLALELTAWSRDLVLLTDGPSALSRQDGERLAAHGIGVREEPIARLDGTEGRLKRIVFATGDVLARRAMFFSRGQRQRSDLAARLGCEVNGAGTVITGEHEATSVPGLFVAGDASRRAQLAIIAAAEGASAAFAINMALIKDQLVQAEREEARV